MLVRCRRLVGCVVALCFLLVACSDDSSVDSDAGPSSDQSPEGEVRIDGVSLRVGVLATTGSVRQTVYASSGAFDDTAYTLEFIDFETSASAVEALNAGAIDMAAAMNSTVAILAQGNASDEWTADTAPFRIVDAAAPVDDPGFQVVVRADSGIESLADLSGRRVAYSRGGFGHFLFAYAAQQEGLEAEDFDIVEMPAGEARAAYSSGSVDALVTTYRNALPVLSDGSSVSLISGQDLLVQHSVSLVRSELLADPAATEAIRDVLRRIDVSERWSSANLDEVAQVYQVEGGLEPDVARLAAQVAPKRRVRVDASLIEALQIEADLFFDEGVIMSRVDVSVLIDDRFDADVGDFG